MKIDAEVFFYCNTIANVSSTETSNFAMRGLSHHKSRLMFTYAEHFARAVEEIDRPGDTKYKKSITVS